VVRYERRAENHDPLIEKMSVILITDT
jgi:hypothetical protein